MGLVTGSGYGLYCLGFSQGKQISPVTNINAKNSPGVKAEKKVLYWQDPMQPTQKFDKPGKSPFMDMELVPVFANDESKDDGDVRINSLVQQNLGMRTAWVTHGNIADAVSAVGSITYNERELVLVQARSNGYLEKLYVRASLDFVQKGQLLAELYMPEWIAAQEEFLTLKRLKTSDIDRLLDAAKQRMRLVGMNDEQIRLVENSDKLHPRLTVTAPISGIISELFAREGMSVVNGSTMFRINGIATVWANAEIPENLATQVHVGDIVEASTPSFPGKFSKAS